MADHRIAVRAFEEEFASLRRVAEKAINQLNSEQLRVSPAPESNSAAVIMKHLAGNFRSRFTDLLTSDGEKPWRDRDGEFVDDLPQGDEGRRAILERWDEGWRCVLDALALLTDADLGRTVTIRGEPHTVARALARSLAHAGYHTGQIVSLARGLVGPDRWSVISVPRGGSAEHNRRMGYEPGR